MLPKRQLALIVVQALLEANPARLAQLAESGQLVNFLQKRIETFKLQFARQMNGQPRAAELTIIESLLPMLAEFPTAKDRPTLTRPQYQKVEEAMDQYEEQNSEAMSPAEFNAATSDLQPA